MLRSGNVAASRGSRPGRDAVALLLLSAFAPTTVVGQRAPQPVFTELFAYDPAVPSQLLGKWLISSQLDSRLQPLRVGVVEDPSGKTVGRVAAPSSTKSSRIPSRVLMRFRTCNGRP